MFWPDHSLREYCLYLGSFEDASGKKYDLGVYFDKDNGRASHAIVFGNDSGDYFSGGIHYPAGSLIEKINKAVYLEYLKGDVVP